MPIGLYRSFAHPRLDHTHVVRTQPLASPPDALSVSNSTFRLGQDRLSSVLGSRTVHVSEGHPILQRIASQAKDCNFHRRFKLMQHTAREGVNKFLGDKVELRSVSKNGRILLANVL